MRRIAKVSSCLTAFFLAIVSLLVSFVPAQAAPRKPSVIVKVSDGSQANLLTKKYNWRIQRSFSVGTGTVLVIEDVSEGQMKQLVKNEASVLLVEDNHLIAQDGGETVLPLDGGETVLPLDGGETVLPLGSGGDQTIGQLVGMPALTSDQLTTIRNAYTAISTMVTPSPRLIVQPSFWQIGLYPVVSKATGNGVVIADLDTGADTCHPVLQGIVTYTFVSGTDANAPENCPTSATDTTIPGYGHGTRVAGLIRLVAPQATVWAVRVFDNTGTADVATVYQAAAFAADHGVNVINMSFGTATYSQALADAVSYAQSQGVVVVAAGGNSNVAPLMYPAQLPGVAGVVAVTNGDIKASFSNYGFGADVSAPGYGVWTAHPGNQMAYVAGTSYSSPLVAAEAALIADAYQRTFRGTASSSYVNFSIRRGVQLIDSLNPLYWGLLGSGRIFLPYALNSFGTTSVTAF
jgi:hypothetical protein